MKFMNFLKQKKGQVSADSLLDKLIGIVILASIAGGIVSTVLVSFTNLTGAGLALAVLFSTVLPLLLAVFIFKALQRTMKI